MTALARRFGRLEWRRLLPLVTVAAVLVTAKVALTGHLLINYTPSIPRGIYWISLGERPQRGSLIAFPIPESARELVYSRQYVPRSIRLFAKPVAAVGGDHVCIRDQRLVVNGRFVSHVLGVDRQGRPMPMCEACGILRPGEVFVATEHDNSFDSRNFGPVAVEEIRGTLTALWTFEE